MTITSDQIKSEMRGLRHFFYVNVLADFLGFAVISLGSLALFPSKAGVFLVIVIAMPLLVWHQSYVKRRMRCPSCREGLFDWEGIPLHAKKCQYCDAELR